MGSFVLIFLLRNIKEMIRRWRGPLWIAYECLQGDQIPAMRLDMPPKEACYHCLYWEHDKKACRKGVTGRLGVRNQLTFWHFFDNIT